MSGSALSNEWSSPDSAASVLANGSSVAAFHNGASPTTVASVVSAASAFQDRDPLSIVIPITAIYMVILVSGIVGNVSTCIVIARNKHMHTATNFYLFSLAISDLLLLVSGLPFEMYTIWHRQVTMKQGALFAVLVLSLTLVTVHCLPRVGGQEDVKGVKGRQESEPEPAAAEPPKVAETATAAEAVAVAVAEVAEGETAAGTAGTAGADDKKAQGSTGVKPHNNKHAHHYHHPRPSYAPAPLIQLNLLSAIGHIISPLLKGILEPLLLNIVFGVVGGVVKTLKHPEIDPYNHYDEPYGDHYNDHHPTKFPESKSAAAPNSSPASGISTLFNGFDAYVMKVPGAGKYLFISTDKNLGEGAIESDKNLGEGQSDNVEEIPFSANPLLNSIFGTIRVRSGPIPDKKVESYVKQQLGSGPDPTTDSD